MADAQITLASLDDFFLAPAPYPPPEAAQRAGESRAAGGRLGPYPVLWIHGEEDALVPLAGTRETIELIRGDRFEEKVYPGARHEVFNETNRDEVIGDVIAFIERALG